MMADGTSTTTPKADEGGGGTLLDKVLAKLDSLHTRMDSYEAKGAKADDDGDLTLEHEGKKFVHGGEKPPVAEDSKSKPKAKADGEDEDEDKDKDKSDSKAKPKPKADDDGDLKLKHEEDRKDSRRKDDDDDDHGRKDDAKSKAKAKADDDDDCPPGMKRDRRDSTKADNSESELKNTGKALEDSAARADEYRILSARLAKLEGRDEISDDDLAAFTDAQARADSVYGGFGKRAPRFLPGETVLNYRRRLATGLRQHSDDWREVKMSELGDKAFAIAERKIYSDAAVAAERPVDLEEGELRPVVKTDQMTGQRQIHYYGRESFIKGLGRAGRRVAAFRNFSS